MTFQETLQSLYVAVYNIGEESRKPQARSEWQAKLKAYAVNAERDAMVLARYREQIKDPVIRQYLEQLGEYQQRLYTDREILPPTAAYEIATRMINIVQVIRTRMEQREAEHLGTRAGIAATAAIILISTIGLASFFFIQSEQTARVVSPTIANLPLGITFLSILVIAIIAMPHRK